MKDLPLSLLSRGCGQLVALKDGGHDGRLEVCFEPEDYFSWRAQRLLLRLSRSGRLLGGLEEPTPPKTYSTRKGHLILYSEDLVSSSASQSVASRKGRGSRQEAELQLHTLKDLTGAILAYRRKQPREGHATGEGHTHTPLSPSHTHLSSVRRPPQDQLSQMTERFGGGVSSGHHPPATTPAPPLQVPYRPRFLCSPRPHHAPSEPLPPITEGLLSQRGEGGAYLQKEIRITPETGGFGCPLTQTDEAETNVQSEADIPGAPMILCSEPEPKAQQEARGRLLEEPHEPALQCEAGCAENASHHGKCSLKRASVDSSWKSSRLSHVSFYGGHMAGGHQASAGQYARLAKLGLRGRSGEGVPSDPSFSILRLPPVPRGPLVSASQKHSGSSMIKPRDPVPHLPPIPEGNLLTQTHTPLSPVIPAQRPDTPAPKLTHTHTQAGPKMAASWETPAVRESHAPRRILLLVPQATREQDAGKPSGVIHGILTEENIDRENKKEREKKREDMDNDTGAKERERDAGDDCEESGERGEHRPPRRQGQQEAQEEVLTLVGLNHQHLILLEPQEGADLAPSLGPLPPMTGRRGPGKQSSMAAYRHNVPEPPEPGQSQPSIVRGSIPVELRDWQKGTGWGTLIMGPDGDIIRLSLWDPSGEHQLSQDDVTEEHAVRILVSEGQQADSTWTILLEPETTVAGEEYSGKAEVTSATRETPHISMRSVARVGVHGDEIIAEGRCGLGTKDGAPAHEQVLRQPLSPVSSQTQAPERKPGVREAASGDQLVSTEEAGQKAEERGRAAHDAGSKRRRETVQAGTRGDALCEAPGDAEPPSLRRGHPSASSHPRIPQTGHSAVQAPSEPAVPQCLSGTPPDSAETLTKPASATQSVRHVAPEVGRERREKREKHGRRERRRGEGERSGGQERREARQRGEKGRRKEGGLQEEDEQEETRKRPAGREKGASTGSSARNRERKTKEESKRGPKEPDAAPKAQRAGGMRSRKAGAKGQDEFVVGKPRPKQEVGQREQEVEKSERNSPEEDEEVLQHDEEEQQQGGAVTGDTADTEERPISTQQRSPSSSSPLCHLDDEGSTPVSRVQSSQEASLPEEAPPSSPPPMSLHQLTSRSASTATDSHVTKPSQSEESSYVNNSRNAEEVARQRERQAAARAEKAERRRQEVERKRREREEEKKRQMEREEREERMRLELEEEQRRRAEETRLKRQREEEERGRREAEEEERRRREEAQRERERRQQEEKRRQMERLQRLRLEEEKRRAEEQERLRQEEARRREEERRRLQEMEESERREYLQRLQQEEEERRRLEEERRRREEEALLWAQEQARQQAELLARQRAMLEQRLSFQRVLLHEAGGLGQSQDISRSWVFSYFALLQLLGVPDHTASWPEDPGNDAGVDAPQLTPT